ncbi:Uncharacterised protein [Serratia quinivorans]|nr:Uncharacterised protein [Serratia quinivorans]
MTQIVWRDLVNIVVEPVGKQQMTMATPGGFWCEFGVIIGEVIQGYYRIKPSLVIATILTRQRQRIILRVSGNKRQRLSLLAKQIGPGLL